MTSDDCHTWNYTGYLSCPVPQSASHRRSLFHMRHVYQESNESIAESNSAAGSAGSVRLLGGSCEKTSSDE